MHSVSLKILAKILKIRSIEPSLSCMSRFICSDHIIQVSHLLTRLGIFGYDAQDFVQAFYHRSSLNEIDFVSESNERLEYLGDAVLELLTTEYLYEAFPDKSEWELTDLRSALVRGKNLALIAKKLGLGEVIVLSAGEEKNKWRENPYILANVFEAFVANLYRISGIEYTRAFINEHVISTLEQILSESLHVDPKSHLQEMTQAQFGQLPIYTLVNESGPDHDHIYEMSVTLCGREIGRWVSSSKRKAHQEAAKNALARQVEWAKTFVPLLPKE